MELDNLIFGKNPLKHVVNVEAKDGHLEIFLEPTPGQIEVLHLPNKFWLLSARPLDRKFIRLKGSLHYKYGKQYDTRKEFIVDRRKYRNEDIYSIYNATEASLVNKGITYFKGLTPKDISILSWDIETNGLKMNEDSKLILISNTYRAGDKVIRRLFSYDEYDNEGEMLDDWCKWVREINPSVLVGHNINSFDFPFMQCIADNNNVTLALGRDGSDVEFDNYESKFRKDGSQDLHYKRVKVYGREIVDTMFLAIKHDIVSKKYETYALKGIIKQEGLEKANRTFYDASQIRFHYQNPTEMAKIKEYAKEDADDALALFDLMVPAFFYMTQAVPKPFQLIVESASGSQINSLLVRSYLQNAHSIPQATATYPFEGAISFGFAGCYQNVFKIDILIPLPINHVTI